VPWKTRRNDITVSDVVIVLLLRYQSVGVGMLNAQRSAKMNGVATPIIFPLTTPQRYAIIKARRTSNMARFRGTVQGGAGQASRLGSESGGIEVRANGWDDGVRASGYVDNNGKDRFRIFVNGGSNGSKGEKLLAVVEHGKITVFTDKEAIEFKYD